MKKVIAIFAIVALAACNGNASTEAKADSIGTQVDSAAITAIDSTTSQIEVDSVGVK